MDPFVSAWYHAATAYMFATGSYGDVTPHLSQGAERLPDDAWMLFDRGCYAEILGLPMHQALVPERDTVGQRASGHSYGNSQTSRCPFAFLPRRRRMRRPSDYSGGRSRSIRRSSKHVCDWRDCWISASATRKRPQN